MKLRWAIAVVSCLGLALLTLNGGVLRVLRVQPEGSKKVGAGEWARSAGLNEGFRFR